MTLETTLESSQEMDELIRTKVALELPHYLSRKPVLCNLTKRHDLVFSILQANVEDGRACFILELEGRASDHDSGVRFLREIGAQVEPVSETISINKAKCTECGACIGICPTNCFSRHPDTWEICLEASNCIACRECTSVCPVRAISLEFVLGAAGPPSGRSSDPALDQVPRSQLGPPESWEERKIFINSKRAR